MFELPGLPQTSHRIECIDMHTGGEPLRVIVNGFPETSGTVLQRRKECQSQHDRLRKLLINEPRGHADMYAALLIPPNPVESDEDEAHFGVIFMHNAGYSTMCGHATIALAKLAVTAGWVPVCSSELETEVRIDAPCGRIVAYVKHNEQEMPVRFIGVPSFVLHTDQQIDLPKWGTVKFDIAYGGAFYAYVDVSDREMAIEPDQYDSWIRFGRELKQAIVDQGPTIHHPQEEDLSFLYGAIFMGPAKDSQNDSRNVCVFADGEVDRCPTGSGVCGRLALHVAKGQMKVGDSMKVESIIGSVFHGTPISRCSYEGLEAVIPEVSGTAFETGRSTFLLDPNDPWPEGFLLR
jgi:trans-L-3-hydroxyproline dehydratase